MTSINAVGVPVTTTTGVVLASDFTPNTADVTRHRWDLGKLRHLIAALGGQPVMVVCERRTGFALIGAQLVEAFDGGPSRGWRVAIRSHRADGSVGTTNYRVDDLGETIVPLTVPGERYTNVRSDAVRSYSAEQTKAILWAQARHGEGRTRGTWTAWPTNHEVHVRYAPNMEHPQWREIGGTPWSGRVRLSDLAD
ncbi:hypothetical protein [Micromonospora sp. WMMC273]|uniref:hypothetical protein n=1 Tax=Micromonospora sp. WMMC273 TaxID=3015157 RepID=UPI0022B63633|nr:hypothetical protein [Micromonospora sp. WMMC273]MCZ7478842.1 hypothetical protein [Micromonospora sp. WMMC273]